MLSNLFGAFYHASKPDNTELFIKSMQRELTPDDVGELYSKILFSKGSEWVFERECRLIVQELAVPDDTPFFPVKRVSLGLRMPEDAEREVAAIFVGRDVELLEMAVSKERYGLEPRPLVRVGEALRALAFHAAYHHGQSWG